MTDLNEAYNQTRLQTINELTNELTKNTQEYYLNMDNLTLEEIQNFDKYCNTCKSKKVMAVINDGGSIYKCQDCSSYSGLIKRNNKVTVISRGGI
jgi:transposase-like protein